MGLPIRVLCTLRWLWLLLRWRKWLYRSVTIQELRLSRQIAVLRLICIEGLCSVSIGRGGHHWRIARQRRDCLERIRHLSLAHVILELLTSVDAQTILEQQTVLSARVNAPITTDHSNAHRQHGAQCEKSEAARGIAHFRHARDCRGGATCGTRMTVESECVYQSSYIALPTLLTVEYHLFLMALSVLPGSDFAISAHFVPILFSALTITDTTRHADSNRRQRQ